MRLYNDKRSSTHPVFAPLYEQTLTRELFVDGAFQDLPSVGIYGLDLYSLFRSAEAVIKYLEKTDPKLADIARERYATLGNFRDEVRPNP